MKTKGLIKLKNPELIPFRFTDRAEDSASARFFFGVEMVAKIKEDIRGLIFFGVHRYWVEEERRSNAER